MTEPTLEDRIATRALVRRGRAKVGQHISSDRARSLIELGLAYPSQIDPLPMILEPTRAAELLAAEPISTYQ